MDNGAWGGCWLSLHTGERKEWWQMFNFKGSVMCNFYHGIGICWNRYQYHGICKPSLNCRLVIFIAWKCEKEGEDGLDGIRASPVCLYQLLPMDNLKKASGKYAALMVSLLWYVTVTSKFIYFSGGGLGTSVSSQKLFV